MTVSGSHISRLFFQNGTVPMYFNYSKDDDPASIISNLQYEVWYKIFLTVGLISHLILDSKRIFTRV